MSAREYGQYCGVTRAMELVGERWAVLIIRDLLVGPRRYGEIATSLPKIPSNILAARLKELQSAGVIRRVPRARVIIYELTPYGRELEPIVLALTSWGLKSLGAPRKEQIVTPESLIIAVRATFRPQIAATLPATVYRAQFAEQDVFIEVEGAHLRVSPHHHLADLALAGGPGIHRLIAGNLTATSALETGVIQVLHGRKSLLGRFAATFQSAA